MLLLRCLRNARQTGSIHPLVGDHPMRQLSMGLSTPQASHHAQPIYLDSLGRAQLSVAGVAHPQIPSTVRTPHLLLSRKNNHTVLVICSTLCYTYQNFSTYISLFGSGEAKNIRHNFPLQVLRSRTIFAVCFTTFLPGNAHRWFSH